MVLVLIIWAYKETEIIVLPLIFANSWTTLVIWAPNSVLVGTIGLALASVLLLYFSIAIGKYKKTSKT